MQRLITVLITLLVVILPATVLAQEAASGTIVGQVVNGTEGGSSVSGIEVTLITYINDTMAETRTTTTDEEGKFRFDSVAVEHEYLVSAKYVQVDYYYPVAFVSGETEAYVEVGVCDTTASDESIRVGLAHTIVNVEEEGLLVTELFWLVNDGDRTYVGAEGVLFFTLPEGAYSFEAPQELMPDYQFLDSNRVSYLVPFPPGDRQLIYSYRLAKPDSGEYILPLEINYPTEIFELMVGGEDIEVAATQLAPAEPVVTDSGERFIHFRGESLNRGSVLDLRISDVSRGHGIPVVILSVIIAAVIVGAAICLVKKRMRVSRDE